MRHRVYGKKLGRTKNQRTALFKSLVRALILEEKIQTTEAKAKSIKGLVDKLVNQAKSPTARRLVSQFLTNPQVSGKLINDLANRFSDRTSGYTTLYRVGRRIGDGSLMVQMAWVEGLKPKKTEKVIKEEVIEEVEKPKKKGKKISKI